jgi:hypothetical protein
MQESSIPVTHMTFARFSLAGLAGAVVICALWLACLMFASSPWASAVLSITLSALTLAPLGIIYRRGERRAYWLGFALCGWTYIAFTFGPGFVTNLRPLLVTSNLLEWSYPWLVPTSRQRSNPRNFLQTVSVPSPTLEGGLTPEQANGSTVDVWVRGKTDTPPSILLNGVPAFYDGRFSVAVNTDQSARLSPALANSLQFIVRPHSPGLFDALWTSPLVDSDDFGNVGHAWFALFAAGAGSRIGRYFHATRAWRAHEMTWVPDPDAASIVNAERDGLPVYRAPLA